MAARLVAWAVSRMPGAVARGIAMGVGGEKPRKAMRGAEYLDLLKTVPGHDEEFD